MNASEPGRWSRPLLLGLIAALTIGVGYFFPHLTSQVATGPVTPRLVSPRGDLAADEKSTIELFENSKDSVVYITTRERVLDPWTRNIMSIPKGTGSGFIWDDAGHVVTNYHVIADASGANVRLADGRDYSASLVGASRAHDLAVLRIAVAIRRPPPVPVGTSQDLRVGQKVFAIGNPFGLDWSLTTGIVSALDRSLAEENGANIQHLIQTDAAINPGNSGGPLLDSAGRLIGINTAIFSPSGAFSGVGFAVPVDVVNEVVPKLISHGKIQRPTLGIEVDEELNRRIVQHLGINGVVILKVTPESAAAVAGLHGAQINADGITPGDIIMQIDDKRVESVKQLLARLNELKVGDTVKLRVLREGHELDVPVVLQAGG
jgi:S1-C subfamily serine protease